MLIHEPFLALHTSVRCIFLKKKPDFSPWSRTAKVDTVHCRWLARSTGRGHLMAVLLLQPWGVKHWAHGRSRWAGHPEAGNQEAKTSFKYKGTWKTVFQIEAETRAERLIHNYLLNCYWIVILFFRCNKCGLPTTSLNFPFLVVVQLLAQSEIQNDSRCPSAPYPHLTNDLDFIQGAWNVTIVLKVNMKLLHSKYF